MRHIPPDEASKVEFGSPVIWSYRILEHSSASTVLGNGSWALATASMGLGLVTVTY